MDMSLVQGIMGMSQAETATKVGMAVQKKSMDLAEMQGQAVVDMMASMGIGQNLNIEA